jgi:1-deoxy-D-xylulose-5-phosphate reductoisomerase
LSNALNSSHALQYYDAKLAAQLAEQLSAAGLNTEVRFGTEALVEVSSLPDVDAVMAAIVGAAGLEPTLGAAKAGKKIMLANKEVLVMAGELFMHAVRDNGATLLPVDSDTMRFSSHCQTILHEDWRGAVYRRFC